MIKVYYQLTLYQKSPLRIGNTGSERTDLELMKDSRGLPFIPGTSLTGVLRDMAEKTFVSEGERKLMQSLFGSEIRADKDRGFSESRVIISDATLPSDTSATRIHLGVREGVGLDEWGVALKGAKYDFEIVETDLPYTAIIEWTSDEAGEEENTLILEPLMRLASKGISLGARSTRGYGRMDVSIKKLVFSFPQDIEKWLSFDPFGTDLFEEALSGDTFDIEADKVLINLDLEVSSGFIVRDYTTQIKEKGTASDTKPLYNSRGNPVIPGTSWAGAFRHHMIDLLREADFGSITEDDVNHLFGLDEENGKYARSRIRFSETEIIGGKDYSITRSSVDRFSAAPRNTALFTSTIHEGGAGRLDITISKRELTSDMVKLLAAAILDLHTGLMTVGGEAGVGRGCMMISGIEVNSRDCIDKLNAYDLTMLEV